ncbi:MAG: hypothetical protein JKY01_12735 [Pseudomonadales bacterium]|nr:hypothetical protein [Pseudomonadales bacterium]
MKNITLYFHHIKQLIGLMFMLSLVACNELPDDSSSSQLIVQVNALETTQAEESFPAEVDRIAVDVVNEQGAIISSDSAAGNSATFNLSVPSNTALSIDAYAFSGDELLYKGSSDFSAAPNTEISVDIILASQVSVSVPLETQAVLDSGAIELSKLVTINGLSDQRLIFAVNGIEGGSETFGFVSDSGSYTPPPNLLEELQVELSATPVAAPSFGESIQVVVSPTAIDLDWFTDPYFRDCVANQELSLVAELTTLSCTTVSKVGISSLQGLAKLTALKELDVSNQSITKIPALDNLTLLSTLSLRGNLLGNIEGLATLTSLQILDLSDNPGLTSIDETKPLDPLTPLAGLRKLTSLDLSCVFGMGEDSVNILREKLPLKPKVIFRCYYLYPETIRILASETLASDQVLFGNLNYSGFIYSVNDIAGGDDKVGRISENGVYTPPPHILNNLLVKLSASPIEAPSFKAEVKVNIAPTPINLIWFTDSVLRDCVARHTTKLNLVAELTDINCVENGVKSLNGLEHLTALQVADFRYNNISVIPPLGALTLLTELDLRENSLGDINELANLSALLTLDLSWNPGFNSIDKTDPLDPLIPLASLINLQFLGLPCIYFNDASISWLQKELPKTTIEVFNCAIIN